VKYYNIRKEIFVMIAFFESLNPILGALLATLFTWGVTALGASFVFFNKSVNRKTLVAMLGFAAGVMIAASCWSLLVPSIELSAEMGIIEWIPPVVGFLAGGGFLFAIDKILPHVHPSLAEKEEPEGIKTGWRRVVLLVLAITLHNFPEGLAVGVAFGAIGAGIESTSIAGAIALAIGIGLQNFPEGLAVSMPLRGEGLSRTRSFMFGQLSAVVEPIAGVLGATLVLLMRPILPYALSFAAGAMIYVVVEELIPESQNGNDTDYSTIGAMLGFATMMFLDVALG
jgi:ZIP family zinc transporter